jgi:hypothetical protein
MNLFTCSPLFICPPICSVHPPSFRGVDRWTNRTAEHIPRHLTNREDPVTTIDLQEEDVSNVSHALDLRPVLGEIARQWQRIHPHDLAAPEALALLSVLTKITQRLDDQ